MSIGSEKREVTPQRRACFANSDGNTNWSICKWGSANPGLTNLSWMSITFVFGPIVCVASGPTYAIRSLIIAIWLFGMISLV